MPYYSRLQWQNGRSALWQFLGLIAAWLYVIALHWDNDGLWFQGDAARHAANGLFWWDFLMSLPVNPVEFALSYYARYPVIHPTAYPPLFYVVEGFLFSVLGPSSYIGKGLVSAFALTGGVYLMVWLRRWVAPEAGWGGLLLMLQPGVISWSNAVMLNVPSMAMGIAALYHTRRWIESPGSRHLYWAGCFAAGGLLIYFHTAVVVPIMLVWILAERRSVIVRDRRIWVILLLSFALLLPLAFIVKQWAPTQLTTVFPPSGELWNPDRWIYYLAQMRRIVVPITLFLGLLGIVFAIWTKRWRKELKYLFIWSGLCYVLFSSLGAREPRYILLLIPPSIILAVIGIVALSHWWSAIFHRQPVSVFIMLLGLATVFHVSMAPLVRFPQIEGFREVVAFLEEVAPRGRFFYDGKYDGIFSFYVRSRDPEFQRGVVLGDKLLYSVSLLTKGSLREYVNSPSDVPRVLQEKCGCEWVAIEKRGASDWIPAASYLREALRGPEFQYVKSFPIRAPEPTRIDVYRFLPAMTVPEELELPFPNLGVGSKFKASPATRSRRAERTDSRGASPERQRAKGVD